MLSVFTMFTFIGCSGSSDDYKIDFMGGMIVEDWTDLNYSMSLKTAKTTPKSFNDMPSDYDTHNINQVDTSQNRYSWQPYNTEENYITPKKNHKFYFIAKIYNPEETDSLKVHLCGRQWGDNYYKEIEESLNNDWKVEVNWAMGPNEAPSYELSSTNEYEVIVEPQQTVYISVYIEIENYDKDNPYAQQECFYVEFQIDDFLTSNPAKPSDPDIDGDTGLDVSNSAYLAGWWHDDYNIQGYAEDYPEANLPGMPATLLTDVRSVQLVTQDYVDAIDDMSGYTYETYYGNTFDNEQLLTGSYNPTFEEFCTAYGDALIHAYFNPTTGDLIFATNAQIRPTPYYSSGPLFPFKNAITIDLHNFNTAQSEQLGSPFAGCENLELVEMCQFDLSSTSSLMGFFGSWGDYDAPIIDEVVFSDAFHQGICITDFSYMFYGATIKEMDIYNLDINNGKYFQGMFKNFTSNESTFDVSERWNFSNAADYSNTYAYAEMFRGAYLPNAYVVLPDLGAGDSNNIAQMFREATILSLDLSNSDVSTIIHYDELFLGATIDYLSLKNWEIPTRDDVPGDTITKTNIFKCAGTGNDVQDEAFTEALTASIKQLTCPKTLGELRGNVDLPHTMYGDNKSSYTKLQEGDVILYKTQPTSSGGSGGAGGGGFTPALPTD